MLGAVQERLDADPMAMRRRRSVTIIASGGRRHEAKSLVEPSVKSSGGTFDDVCVFIPTPCWPQPRLHSIRARHREHQGSAGDYP